jgi:hypothetical protein
VCGAQFPQSQTARAHVGYVALVTASLILDSSVLSREIRAAYLGMELVTLRGSSLQAQVSRTFYGDTFQFMDAAVKPSLSYWPLIGAYSRVLKSENQFTFLHLLFVLDCQLQHISMHTLSGVRFMGAINAIWSTSDGDCVNETPRMITLAGHITWKAVFAAEPTPTNIRVPQRLLPQQMGNPRPQVPMAELGLPLAGSPRTPHCVRGIHSVALRTYTLEREVVTWAMTSLHSACLALISVHGMSDHKWKRNTDELKKILPATTFPTVARIRQEGPLMRGFLIKTVA